MIPERYQVTGVPVGGGERVIGYYIDRLSVDGKRKEPIIFNDNKHPDGWYSREIDPDTIKPVRVRPIFSPNGCCPDALCCPNCNYDLMGGVEADAEHDPPYCWECGMALDWPKRSQSGWPDKEG